jgi:mannosyl-3-phosphoglycerate phosphatase
MGVAAPGSGAGARRLAWSLRAPPEVHLLEDFPMGACVSPVPPVAAARRGGLLVFTDLDGTLLDHDSYSWEPAREALERLRAGPHRVILTSSKTLAELEGLQQALELDGPAIAENGALLGLPGQLAAGCGPERSGPWRICRLSPFYGSVARTLADLRSMRGYRWIGFADLTTAGVARLTGLDTDAARAARRRLGSEPLLWQDTPVRLAALDTDLAELGLRRVTGGRFHHVLGAGADKAAAMGRLRALLAAAGEPHAVTVALGDGPNDLEMLAAADRPVLVANPRAPTFDTGQVAGLIRTRGHGPVGWAEAMHTLLDDWQTTAGPGG